MLQGVNIEEIKKYNASLKQCRDRSASLKAEIEYTSKEIENLCNDLSAELGVSVTIDNAEQIYAEQIEKINSTLQSGNAVLAKIASEESGGAQETVAAQPTPVTPVAPVMNSTPVTPVGQPVPPVAPTPPVQPVAAQEPQVGGQPLPNFFGNQF